MFLKEALGGINHFSTFFCNHLWHLLCTFLCAEVFYISLSGSFIPTCIYGFPPFDLNFYIFFLGAIHKLHSSHHNGNEYTMAWVEVLPEETFLLLLFPRDILSIFVLPLYGILINIFFFNIFSKRSQNRLNSLNKFENFLPCAIISSWTFTF